MRDLLLCEPLLDGGVEDVAFWNGRVLVAEDLADQQAANHERTRRVGRALGDGVADGLIVRADGADPTMVTVAAGGGVTRSGDVLELADDVRVALVPPPPGTGSAEVVFADCSSPDPSGTLAGVGIYVLVMSPARGDRATAPAVTFEADGVVRDCGPKYSVDGVTFKLVLVDARGLAVTNGHDQADLDVLDAAPGTTARQRFRNVLAHLFLGTVEAREVVVDPFGVADGSHGALDDLRDAGSVDDDDLPIAVVSWSSGGVEFVEPWAVRRLVHRSRPAPSTIASWGAPRRGSEGEAAWMCFQDHLAELLAAATSTDRSSLRLVDHVRYLPAVGLAPLENPPFTGVFDVAFLDGITTRGPDETLHLTAPRAVSLLERSFTTPAHDLDSGEFVWVYGVSENRLRAQGVGGTPVQPYLYIASGHLPYLGDAQFDLARADASNVVLAP